MPSSIREAAAARAAQGGNYGRPRQRRAHESTASLPVVRVPLAQPPVLRAASDGSGQLQFDGYATVYEYGYEMWDFFGPYTETVSVGAGAETLSQSPDVAFLLNHGGMTLARTKSGTLNLAEEETGLRTLAGLDPRMSVVRDIEVAMERGDLDEMSFAFRITAGQWSPDYTEYRINKYDIDRGDVSIVNFGANPGTSGTLRSRDVLAALEGLDETALREVEQRVRGRLTPAARGASLALIARDHELSARP